MQGVYPVRVGTVIALKAIFPTLQFQLSLSMLVVFLRTVMGTARTLLLVVVVTMVGYAAMTVRPLARG